MSSFVEITETYWNSMQQQAEQFIIDSATVEVMMMSGEAVLAEVADMGMDVNNDDIVSARRFLIACNVAEMDDLILGEMDD